MAEILFPTSLVASFVAGMVALFAPCCITFLLPAYLGSVFKEKRKVMLMTLVFGAGIFVFLMPAVLGVAIISQFLFRNHDSIYLFSGGIMLSIAVISLLGIKLPMPNWQNKQEGQTDVISIFILGIFSGLTSACCAPVLVGILAMTFLSPSFFGATLLGAMYVLGMVTPLLLISLFLSGRMPKLTILRKPLATVDLLGKTYPIFLSNMMASSIFLITGTLTIILTLNGRLTMDEMEGATKTIQNAGAVVNSLVGGNIALNILFLGLILMLIYLVARKV